MRAGFDGLPRGISLELKSYEGDLIPAKRANVKNERQYEALKEKGMSKQRAARIANSPGASSRVVRRPLVREHPSHVCARKRVTSDTRFVPRSEAIDPCGVVREAKRPGYW